MAVAPSSPISAGKREAKSKRTRLSLPKKPPTKAPSPSSPSSPALSPAKRTKNPRVRVVHGRIYDFENGKTCHHVFEPASPCPRNPPLRLRPRPRSLPAKRTKNPGVRVVHGRIYDYEKGKTCHQCRQKTRDFVASCKRMRGDKLCVLQENGRGQALQENGGAGRGVDGVPVIGRRVFRQAIARCDARI